MGAIYMYRHGSHLDLWTMTRYTYFLSPFNTRFHMKFEEIWPRGFREVVQRCERQTDGWMMDARRRTGSDQNHSSWALGSGEQNIKSFLPYMRYEGHPKRMWTIIFYTITANCMIMKWQVDEITCELQDDVSLLTSFALSQKTIMPNAQRDIGLKWK